MQPSFPGNMSAELGLQLLVPPAVLVVEPVGSAESPSPASFLPPFLHPVPFSYPVVVVRLDVVFPHGVRGDLGVHVRGQTRWRRLQLQMTSQ